MRPAAGRLVPARPARAPWGSTWRAMPATCGRCRAREHLLGIALVLLPLALVPVDGATAAGEQVAVRAATHPGFGRLVFEWPSPVEVDSRQSAGRLTLRFARPPEADLGPVVGRLGDYLVALPPGADDREVVLQLAPDVGADVDIHNGRIVVVDLRRAAATSAPVALRMGVHDGYARIVLDWAVPVSFTTAGADRRWRIVFDREGRIDTATIGQRFRDLLDGASTVRGGGRSELELALKPGVTVQVYELAGERVVIDLYPPASSPPTARANPATAPTSRPADPAPPALPPAQLSEPAETALAGVPDEASEGAPPEPLVLQTTAPEPGSADRERDASAAIVNPTSSPSLRGTAAEENRLAAPRPEAAIRHSDPSEADRSSAPEPESQPAGSPLSDPIGLDELLKADAPPGPPGLEPLGLARFAAPDEASRSEQRATLQDRVASAPPTERRAARLELARWFLAQAMATEALSVLGVLGEPGAAEDPHRLARNSLAGAAALLMGRLDAAAAGLEVPALDADPESALWRAALSAARADWPAAARALKRSGTTLSGYPPRLQLRLGLPAVRIAIQAGDEDLTKLVLAQLRALDLHPIDRARLAFLEGLAHAGRGEIDSADQIWRALEQGPNYETRVDAAYARIQTLLETGRLTAGEALDRLESARVLWRGHPSEFDMLDRLAELRQQSGDPAAAIRIWQELLARFPTAPRVKSIAGSLQDAFVNALLAEDGPTIGAMQAYSLYRDFPELPRLQDANGDRLRRRLAEQLAGLELIEPAAHLLDELIEQRLAGPAKAEAGADLAELWLRQPDAAAALAALDRSGVDDQLPPALNVRRRVLRARALAAANQTDAALALLEDQPGSSEQRLRAELLWQNRDWPRLVDCVEGLLARRDDPKAPLSAEDQELVIRLALAYARQAEPGALERLRVRFASAMRGQASEAAFLMVTLPRGRPVEPDAALALAAEHLARTRDYLASEPASR